MEIEVSIGEVVDKLTILSLKMIYMEEREKLVNVNKERQYLLKKLEETPEIIHDELYKDLLDTNNHLWTVEDEIRDLERKQQFDGDFIRLARSVYRLNDKRAAIKKDINLKYGSDFIEEKSYKPY